MKEVLTKRVWASVALLSIIVPVGLLATFRLTGVLKEPPKPESVTVEAVTWNMSRPTGNLNIPEVRNSYATGVVSIDFNISGRYVEQYSQYGYNDVLTLGITGNVTLSDGFVHSMTIHFSEIDAYAFLDAEEDPDHVNLHNLSTYRVKDFGASGEDAYIVAESLSRSRQCVLGTGAHWIFTDQNNQPHRMRVTLEAVYYDGGTYQQVDLPITLQVTVG